MTNAQISDTLTELAKLKELLGANSFATAAYTKAAQIAERLPTQATDMDKPALVAALGKGMAERVATWLADGEPKELAEVHAQIPEGVLEIMQVPGYGVKRVGQLWHEHAVTSLEQLAEMATNGELSKISGFGQSMQAALLSYVEEKEARRGLLRLDKADALAQALSDIIAACPATEQVEVVGELARGEEIIHQIEILAATTEPDLLADYLDTQPILAQDVTASAPMRWAGHTADGVKVDIYMCQPQAWAGQQVYRTGPESFLKRKTLQGSPLGVAALQDRATASEYDVVERALGFYLEPELRDAPELAPPEGETLITLQDIKGILHCHSTYSDGTHTLEEMATACRDLGYAYFGIADHSQTATYAKGLGEYAVKKQWEEIDQLNEKLTPFRILKGIESDILPDGSLDYPDQLLAGFDYVVASVHSSLKMSEDKAMTRLLAAVANPHTTILGHPTGRLILKRDGYPVDWPELIEACHQHNVVLELNANAHRLDTPWRQCANAAREGVSIAINPDAHKIAGFYDMRFGITMARKAGLTPGQVFNTMSLKEIMAYLKMS